LESDELEHASTAYAAIHEQFPLAPEPYLASARVAMAEGDFAAAVTALQELLADNPTHTDALLGLAQCFEATGDLVAARDLLESSAALFDVDDPDFNASLGTLNKKLFERYGMDAYRTAAVRLLSNALRGATRLGLSEAPLHLALRALDAGVGENVVASRSTLVPRGAGAPRDEEDDVLWILAADASLGAQLVRDRDIVLRAPEDARPGQTVLLTRGHPRLDGVEMVSAAFTITSLPVPDARYGRAVSARLVKTLSVPIEVELHDVRYPVRDGWGCENFADGKHARFYGLPLGLARELLAQVNAESASGDVAFVASTRVDAGTRSRIPRAG
jgi:tetratricopeptide (TPR) repeat protein